MLRLQSGGFHGMFVASARDLPASVDVFIFVNKEKTVGRHVLPRYDCFRHSGTALPIAEAGGRAIHQPRVRVGGMAADQKRRKIPYVNSENCSGSGINANIQRN
jgi:hypothetical protein